MSTRWYPIYQKGNPQLRVFLPNFWMKLVPSERNAPENVVQFHCSMEMTRYDVRNYLEKIYNVYPADIRMRIALGKVKRLLNKTEVVKEDDIKIAYITLPKGQTFAYPRLFDSLEDDEKTELYKKMTEQETKKARNDWVPTVPNWFRR